MRSTWIKWVLCSFFALLFLATSVCPCFAETGTISSVDEKAAPTVIFSDSSGNALTRIEGGDAGGLPLTPADLEVRSYAERRNPDALLSVSDELMYAYRALNSVSSLGELEQQLDFKAWEINETYSAAAFVVSDLFAVSLSDEKASLFGSGGEYRLYLTVQYDTEAAGHRPVVICRNASDQSWSLAEVDENSDDGVVSVCLSEPCVLAFLVADGERMRQREAVSSERHIWIAVIAIIAVIFAASALFVIFYHRGHAPAHSRQEADDHQMIDRGTQ